MSALLTAIIVTVPMVVALILIVIASIDMKRGAKLENLATEKNDLIAEIRRLAARLNSPDADRDRTDHGHASERDVGAGVPVSASKDCSHHSNTDGGGPDEAHA